MKRNVLKKFCHLDWVTVGIRVRGANLSNNLFCWQDWHFCVLAGMRKSGLTGSSAEIRNVCLHGLNELHNVCMEVSGWGESGHMGNTALVIKPQADGCSQNFRHSMIMWLYTYLSFSPLLAIVHDAWLRAQRSFCINNTQYGVWIVWCYSHLKKKILWYLADRNEEHASTVWNIKGLHVACLKTCVFTFSSALCCLYMLSAVFSLHVHGWCTSTIMPPPPPQLT